MSEKTRGRLFIITIGAILACVAMTAAAGITYTYDQRTLRYTIGAEALLITYLAGYWFFWRRGESKAGSEIQRTGLATGLGLGLLWTAEICYNNIIAAPLPGRDTVDNIFWALVGLGLLVLAGWTAYRGNMMNAGVRAGLWAGFGSGLVACSVALAMVVFGMGFIAHDPLNVEEWSALAGSNGAPSMAAYFAFETIAGAMIHLVILGSFMGWLAGLVGGAIGQGVRILFPNRSVQS